MTHEQPTSFVAGVAITSPWWIPTLQNWSDISALLLPIAGVIWLTIQIVGYCVKYVKENKR